MIETIVMWAMIAAWIGFLPWSWKVMEKETLPALKSDIAAAHIGATVLMIISITLVFGVAAIRTFM